MSQVGLRCARRSPRGCSGQRFALIWPHGWQPPIWPVQFGMYWKKPEPWPKGLLPALKSSEPLSGSTFTRVVSGHSRRPL